MAVKYVVIKITIEQLRKLLKLLDIATSAIGVKWLRDKDIKSLIARLQAEYYDRTGRWL